MKRNIPSAFQFIFIALLVIVFAQRSAYANCTTPDSEAGTLIYNADHKVPQFCDGANWVAMVGSGTDSDTLGDLSCTADQIVKWNGSAWICAADGVGTGDNLGNHTATAVLDMATHKISNVTDPTLDQDAATKAYVDTASLSTPPVCTGDDKALQWNGSVWSCAIVSSGMTPVTTTYNYTGALQTWTKPDTGSSVEIKCWGGGAGGGYGGSGDGGGAGGGGGYVSSTLSFSSLGATETVTIGNGGSGGVGGNGSAGEASSFGAHLSALGGSGGISANYPANVGGSGGGNGGDGGNGDGTNGGGGGGAGGTDGSGSNGGDGTGVPGLGGTGASGGGNGGDGNISNATAPGGGGGGGRKSTNGYAGASGRCIVTTL